VRGYPLDDVGLWREAPILIGELISTGSKPLVALGAALMIAGAVFEHL
jgi:hypothetical protein